MAKPKDNIEEKQLYSMFNKLRSCTDNESDFNRIFGYSLFEALSSYNPPTVNLSEDQAKFYEIKHFYNTLEKNIDETINQGSHQVSISLMVIEDLMASYLHDNEKPKSMLLEKIINSNSYKRAEKNFSAYIESKTDKTYRLVLDKGSFKGNKNILLNDYESLLKSFI